MTRRRVSVVRAMRLYHDHRYPEALRACRRVLARDPAHMAAFFLACRVLYKRSEYGRLGRMLRRCTPAQVRAAGPRFEGLYCYYRGKCCQFRLEYRNALNWLSKALDLFDQARHPADRIETLLPMAEVCRMLQGEFHAWGEELLRQADEEIGRLPPGSRASRLRAMYHGFMGRWCLSAGDSGLALKHFAEDRRLMCAAGDTEYAPFMDILLARCLNDLGQSAEAAAKLAAVPPAYVRRHPKERLYYLLERAFLAARQGGVRARRLAQQVRRAVKRSDHRDPYAFLRLVDIFERTGDSRGTMAVCRDGVRIVEQARRRLRDTQSMQEFREWWSPFYRRAIVALVRQGDPEALVFHVMNHTRTLVDLVAWGRGERSLERTHTPLTRAQDRWYKALAGASGGVRLDRRTVVAMLAEAADGEERPLVVFTTWVRELGGLFVVMAARNGGRKRPPVIAPPWTCRTADPATPSGRCQMQTAFGRWLAAQPEPSRVVLIPDDLTRAAAFHTADAAGRPAFCIAPIVYEFSLALAARRPAERPVPPMEEDEDDEEDGPRWRAALLYDDSDRALGARPECAELAAVVESAAPGQHCHCERLTVRSLVSALRCFDVVHLAGHHCEGPGGGIRTSEGAMVRQAAVLALRRCRARLVTAALCDSAASSSSVYNEPRGVITALFAVGCRAVVATRAPVTGEESSEWMAEFYRNLCARPGALRIDTAYFETMWTMYRRWKSPERTGKFVLFGGTD